MVVYVDGFKDKAEDLERLQAVIRWMAANPTAAARLILMLMPEGNWTETDSMENWN